MARVTFESSDGGKRLTVEAPAGGAALADLCDDHEAPIPFSCRSASCATCHVEVLEGEAALLPADEEELDVLDVIACRPPRHRLACCARVKPDAGAVHVVVRAQNDF